MDFNFANLFGQAQNLQKELQKIQEELKTVTVTESTGGGMVTVQATGQMEITGIKIDPELIKSADFEFLEELIRSAINQALVKAKSVNQEKLNSATGGLLSHLPPGFKIPGL